ncbi:hypothetical protein [Paenibacillus illinoisensis]|uniref:hypothetical protein n=1 Tax=Paenibacillus illinoisensis TaxID=59845 RepID=UPI00301E0FDE
MIKKGGLIIKVQCIKDVIITNRGESEIMYRNGEVFDAYNVDDDLLIKEKDGSSSLIGVRKEAALVFNISTGSNQWDDWFNDHFVILNEI